MNEEQRFIIKNFKLKDYAYQCRNQIHCVYKYVVLIYDQMCKCGDEYGNEDQLINCQGDYDSLGLINYTPSQFRTIIEDIAFQFDSEKEASACPIASQLLLILKDWCRKITKVQLNTSHVYTTELKNYNAKLIDQIVQQIKLHKNIDKDTFLKLKHLVVDMEVVFTDLHYRELSEIGMNLSYCNYLIYDYLRELYASCGFYLSSNSAKPENMPFYHGKQKINSAYCHLYLIPLNLKEYYYYQKRVEQGDPPPLNNIEKQSEVDGSSDIQQIISNFSIGS